MTDHPAEQALEPKDVWSTFAGTYTKVEHIRSLLAKAQTELVDALHEIDRIMAKR